MNPPKDISRECLFSRRFEEENREVFVALYQSGARLLLVISKEKGGDIEVELAREAASELLSALQRELKKEEPNQPLQRNPSTALASNFEPPARRG